VAVNVLDVKFRIKFLGDMVFPFVFRFEDVLELGVFEVRIRLSFLPQSFRGNYFGVWESSLPSCEVEMVLEIGCSNIFELTTLRCDCPLHFGGERDRGEDG
jgi:hypothetical protein